LAPPEHPDDAHPYLRAATAGIRHHTHTPQPANRVHLDALHAHITALHQLLNQLAMATKPRHPASGRRLATAHNRLWQATAEIHDAFHLQPAPSQESGDCRPEQLPEGPPFLTICQRHLAAGHTVRRTTTPADLSGPHTTGCAR
jgi:Family of unknown function (DUF6238)